MDLWPQYTYLAICFIGIGLTIANHGKPRTKENAIASIIAWLVIVSLLAAGGFFKGM